VVLCPSGARDLLWGLPSSSPFGTYLGHFAGGKAAGGQSWPLTSAGLRMVGATSLISAYACLA
jgi:hypothetical protein